MLTSNMKMKEYEVIDGGKNALLLMASSECAVQEKCILKYARVYRAGRALVWMWVCGPYLDLNLYLYNELNKL